MAAPKGNQYGKSKGLFSTALKRAMSRRTNGSLRAGLDQLADVLLTQAMAGESWAMAMVFDRIDGKAIQPIAAQIEHTGSVELANADTLQTRLSAVLSARASQSDTGDPVH